MKTKIFISHATPDDNEFTRWLALKLIALGYDVWCDVLYLEKGIDFWSKIESVIRNETCKFLLVSSSFSNQRQGVLKELAVAEKVKKQLADDAFIFPLAIDMTLSFDDINIDIVRLNGIDFRKSWAIGLNDLLEALQKNNVPRSDPNPDKTNLLYQQIFLHDRDVVKREENYVSNWFDIVEFPHELRFHMFDKRIPRGFDIRNLPYPAVNYKKYLCTFAYEFDFIEDLPKTYDYGPSNTIRIPTSEILSGEHNSQFIGAKEAQRLIIQLVNKAFEKQMERNGLREYEMSNKLGYWFQKDQLEKDKHNKVLLVGKMKEKNWHFGISATGKLYPSPILMFSTHVYFTQDGINLIESSGIQHSARRKRSRSWWNNDWRTKLLAFADYLANGEDTFFLEVGSEERIYVSSNPIRFIGEFSYDIPQKELDDEDNGFDDFPFEDGLEDFEELQQENRNE